jgi:hypothetical protein
MRFLSDPDWTINSQMVCNIAGAEASLIYTASEIRFRVEEMMVRKRIGKDKSQSWLSLPKMSFRAAGISISSNRRRLRRHSFLNRAKSANLHRLFESSVTTVISMDQAVDESYSKVALNTERNRC